MSFLYQRNATTLKGAYASLLPSTNNGNQWAQGAFYGHHWSTANIVNRPYGFANGTSNAGTAIAQDTTYFVLAKLELSDTLNTGVADTATSTLWVYESGTHDLPIAAPSGGAVVSGSRGEDRNFTDFWFVHQGADSGDHTFDELRIGTTFESVVVPEPSAASLFLGLGAIGFAMFRRR